jgi:glycosyltransferase involved in cell wall biosynthesis
MDQSTSDIAVSVVVPAYNRASLLVRLLDSLAAMTEPPSFEIIVVDDASTDHTREVVDAWINAHPAVRCRYIGLERNGGPGRARNRGLEEACGVWVAFTDTDCVVSAGWLASLYAPLAGDRGWAGAGGAVQPYNPESIFAAYNTINHTLEPIVYGSQPIPYLVTCNCCYHRETLLKAGGFTADLGTPGGEDVAASISLYKSGHRFTYAGDALVYHDYGDTLRSFVRTWRNYGFGCGLVTHRLLTPEELHPEWQRADDPNYWGVQSVRPTVTGVRSFIWDLQWFWGRCREKEVPRSRRPALMALRMERWCYYWGWRRGAGRA